MIPHHPDMQTYASDRGGVSAVECKKCLQRVYEEANEPNEPYESMWQRLQHAPVCPYKTLEAEHEKQRRSAYKAKRSEITRQLKALSFDDRVETLNALYDARNELTKLTKAVSGRRMP